MGKVVLITGAASGFGKCVAEKFAELGAKLILSDIQMDKLQTVAQELEAKGAEVYYTACNIADRAQVQAMVAGGVEKFGQLDIAINNAGLGHMPTSLTNVTDREIDMNVNVNIKGTTFCMQAELDVMKQQGFGSILNVSSVAGITGAPTLSLYSAAKHALIGLTKSAAVENARRNIRINALCPAFCETPMVEQMVDVEHGEDRKKGMLSIIPMGRFGTANEVAEAMAWLTSDLNSFMTGQAIILDGGLMAG